MSRKTSISQNQEKSGSSLTSTVEGKTEKLNTFLHLEYENQESKDMKPPTALQKILRCRNQPNSQYYFTSSAKGVKKTRDVTKEQSPFWYPQSLKQEAYTAYSKTRREEIRKSNLNIKYSKRDNYESRNMRDLRQRLFIPEIPSDIRTIVDVDPDFFSIVDGRPIQYKFDKTGYMNDVKDIMLFKSLAGFREDEIIRMEEIIKDEEAMYNDVCKRYNKYVDNFEQFVLEDYTKSKGIMKVAEDLHNNLENKIEEYNNLSIQLGITRRKAYILEEKCRESKMYKEFLQNVSPTVWRVEQGLDEIGGLETFDDSTGGMFSKFQVGTSDGTVVSLTSIIQQFYKENKNYREPNLFFTEAHQLLDVFKSIVHQNMNTWMHCEYLTGQLEAIKGAVNLMKSKIQEEFDEIDEIIKDMNEDIQATISRAQYLKQKALKIIHNQYHHAVSSEYAVKLNVCVKDIYEKLIDSTVEFSTFTMLKSLQSEYESTVMQMDGLDPEIVSKVRKETFAKDKTAMLNAFDAHRKLKNLQSVHRTLMKNLDPPFKKIGKPVMFKSKLHIKKEKPED